MGSMVAGMLLIVLQKGFDTIDHKILQTICPKVFHLTLFCGLTLIYQKKLFKRVSRNPFQMLEN